MRQLDLFGSLLETPPQEKKPEVKAVVARKEENNSNAAKGVSPSYSKNSLRSERLPGEKLAPSDTNESVGEEEIVKNQSSPSAPVSLPLFSLFDAHPLAANEQSESNLEAIREDTQEPAIESPTQIYQEPEKVEGPVEQPSALDVLEAVLPKTEVLIVEDEPEAPSKATLMQEPVVGLKKREVSPKPKKVQVPELQRSGSVIFDDGKITVKIKNASPFPAPLVKEKKEKVKKPVQKRGRKSFKEIDAEVDLIEIPEDEILFQKQYYPISEVAKWFRVNTSLLRFWENEFDVLKPRKNRKGDRLFRPEDVKNLQLIYHLLRQRKYTIEGAKEYIKTNKKKADIQLQLTNTLQKFRGFLLDLKANLQP
jgi:DNA-binding transcriptional MerR regulator